MKLLFASLLLVVVMLTSGQVRAQDSDIITVTGLYVGGFEAEDDNTLHPCHVFELWAVETGSSAFTALSAAYDGADSAHLSESGGLFVEVRGRYRTYEDAYGDEGKVHAHSDGLFEITEFVRSSTAAADITACEWTCEREHGANSPICLAQVDGQCGSTRNSCIAGSIFDDDVSIGTIDTTTEYHWVCLGAFGGDDSECMAPKAATPPSLRGAVAVVSRLRSGPLTLYGWAYNTASSTATIPVEIYVGGAHGTGTLAETITADQPRADVNTAQSITGDHGFEWVVPTQYQSSE